MRNQNTILVIEDDPETLENIVSILELAHYRVITAQDGNTGIDKVYQTSPDLILCDIMMPGLDGYGVLHLLSKYLETSLTPFIFLTARNDWADLRKGMNMGADDFITKPFDSHELLNVVALRLHKSKASGVYYDLQADEDPALYERRKRADFQKLVQDRLIRRFKKKSIIYAEGQNPTEMFFIHSGKVKTLKNSASGKELIIGLHREGDCFGYVPLIENTMYYEGAVALTDAELALVPKSEFLSTLYSNRDIARMFIGILSYNLQDAEKRLVELAYQSVRQKVVEALFRIHDRYDLSLQDTPVIQVSRKDLSNLVGTTTESLNRTLGEFKESGWIDFVQGGIQLLDKASLANLLKTVV